MTARVSSAMEASTSCIGRAMPPRNRSGCSATSSAMASLWTRQNEVASSASMPWKNVSGLGDSSWRSMPARSMSRNRFSTSMNTLPR